MPVNLSGIDRMLARAIMSGLLRYPALFASDMEAIGQILLGDEKLERLRSAAVEATLVRHGA